MQTAYSYKADKEYSINIPSENSFLTKEIKWGKFDEFFTPAYWYAQTWFSELHNESLLNYRLGSNFKEEVIACILGGHGIPSEIGVAKFSQFKNSTLLINKEISYEEILRVMNQPIIINNKEKKYRFINQKSKYIYDALLRINKTNEKKYSDLELREFLLTIKGIGPKTASWIVRNHRNSDEVAILDIHLYRAGVITGLFDKKDKVEKNYFKLEKLFLAFSNALGVKASKLDAVIWRHMKELNNLALRLI